MEGLTGVPEAGQVQQGWAEKTSGFGGCQSLALPMETKPHVRASCIRVFP